MLTDIQIRSAVERHAGMVFRLAYARTRRREDAEDIFQEVFLRMAQREGAFESDDHFALYRETHRDYIYNNPGLSTLKAPSGVEMSVLVFRAKAPIRSPPTEASKIVGEVSPLAIEPFGEAAAYGKFYYDRVRGTFVETHDNPLTFGGAVTEADTTLPPGETRVHEYIEGKFLGAELWNEEGDSLLSRMGLKEEWNCMRKDLSLSQVERMRWYGMLLEKMGFGEIAEELPVDYIPPEFYEGHLLIDAVGEYPDTIVIVPFFSEKGILPLRFPSPAITP